jgi:hypothetical protein
MGFQHQAGEDFSSGSFLQEPGTYHLCVTEVQENPTNKGGSLIPNAAFRINCEVLAGTVGGQESKTTDLLFFHPKPGDKNGGAFARKKIDRFLLAVGLMDENAKGKNLDINLQQAIGRHFVVKLEMDDDNKFLQIAYSDIFHPDDPSVARIPKSEMAMGMPGSWRKIGAKPAANGTTNGATNGTAPAVAGQAAPFDASTL